MLWICLSLEVTYWWCFIWEFRCRQTCSWHFQNILEEFAWYFIRFWQGNNWVWSNYRFLLIKFVSFLRMIVFPWNCSDIFVKIQFFLLWWFASLQWGVRLLWRLDFFIFRQYSIFFEVFRCQVLHFRIRFLRIFRLFRNWNSFLSDYICWIVLRSSLSAALLPSQLSLHSGAIWYSEHGFSGLQSSVWLRLARSYLSWTKNWFLTYPSFRILLFERRKSNRALNLLKTMIFWKISWIIKIVKKQMFGIYLKEK